MSFVRTVLGDIEPSALGVCYAHEHVVIDQSAALVKLPQYDLSDTDRIVAELQTLKRAGVRSMIDAMPGGGAGRSVLKLAEVSRRSGMHIVAPTGLHLEKYYPTDHWSLTISEEALAEVFVAEIDEGMDANDLVDPAKTLRPPYHAGLIKVAGGLDKLTARQRRCFAAAAKAQASTGAPILTHTEQGTAALEQIEILRENGADLTHVVLSHTDRRPDIAYQREILSTGVRLEFDSAFRWTTEQGNPTLDLIVALHEAFPSQIMLGMDAARPSYWRTFGGTPGLEFLIKTFVPVLLRAGVSQAHIDRMFIDNPAQAFQFTEQRSTQ